MKRLLGVVQAHVSLHLLQLSDTDLRCIFRVAAASGFSMVLPAFFTFLGGKGLFKVRRSTAQQVMARCNAACIRVHRVFFPIALALLLADIAFFSTV